MTTVALFGISTSQAAFARCSNNLPADGETVTCDTSASNPDTAGIGPLTTADATTLPRNVTVNMLAGSAISLAGTTGFPVIRLGEGANVTMAAGSRITTANGGGIGISTTSGSATESSQVDIAGSITARGIGVSYSGPGASIMLRDGGSISTNAQGIYLTTAGTGLIDVSGSISMTGDVGAGTGAVQTLTATGGNASILLGTTGSITTSGANALGIFGQGPSNSITVAGSTMTTGAGASGVAALGGSSSATANTIAVNGTGRIDTSGKDAAGIVFGAFAGRLTLDAGAQVHTSGTGNAAAVYFLDQPSSQTQVTNNGSLIADNTTAIQGRGAVVVNNMGTISGTTGIAVLGATGSQGTFISNQGTITGTGGVAIDMRAATTNMGYTIFAGSVTNGTVLGGSGINRLSFGNTASGADMTFDWSLINKGGAAQAGEQYFGFSVFDKIGANKLILTGGGGTGSTGNFSLFGGTTVVNGDLSGTAFVVNGGARLEGTGTTGGLTMFGTLSPGGDGAIGTLTVNGDLTFVANSGSLFRVDIGNGVNDRVNVTGTATLAGSVAAFATGVVLEQGTYTLLNAAGGVTGTFAALSTNPDSTARLTYDPNNVYLVLDQQTGITATASTTESIVLLAPTATTNRIDTFQTRIIGKIEGGQPLYNQTFTEAVASSAVQNGVTAARAAITTAGGPGVIIGNPVRTASTTTTSTTSTTVYSLAGNPTATTSAEIVVGPGSTTIGARTVCTGISALPGPTAPTCSAGSATAYTVNAGQINTNTNVDTVYSINQSRTDTVTTTLSETYELTGQVAAVGEIHAEVQSGLFDLGGRMLSRIAAPRPVNAGWAEGYGFQVRQRGRRDAYGFAAGVNLQLAPGISLALGADHGKLDIDVPGALENGDVTLTEGAAALQVESGGFTAALAASYGKGHAETTRTIVGSSAARYGIRVSGAALEVGYGFESGPWTLRPVAGIDLVSVHSDGFTESDTLGLVVGAQKAHRWRGSAGLEVVRKGKGFELAASARYQAVLSGDDRSVPVAFALAPARTLAMNAPSEPDSALIGARAVVDLSAHASLMLRYDGQFGSGYTSHAGLIGLAIRW
ncbi:uncharacterized protein with beta-barrel porin domain [Sphingobium sp. OAS761]|nr:uncharacterized protein with beta-barrel porin domain [Sphingobium sp. OAS761]